jgi:CheY-like chemotaxis protein
MHLVTRTPEELLREGVAASKAGNDATARELFLQVAHEDPSDETAWIYLASVTNAVHLRISYIRRALEINPQNARARLLMETCRKTVAEGLVRKAKEAVRSGNQEDAANFLLAASEFDPGSEDSWIGLACLNGPAEDRETILRQALQVNPANERLQAMLRTLEQRPVGHTAAPTAAASEPAEALTLELAVQSPLELEPATPEPVVLEPSPTAGDSSDVDQYPSIPSSLDTDVQIEIIEDDTPDESDPLPPSADVTPAEARKMDGQPVAAAPDRYELVEPAAQPLPERPASAAPPAPEIAAQQPESAAASAIPDGCPLCMEALSGQPERCPSCGGRLKLWDPRVDSKDFAATRVDQRKMLLAVNRCSVTLRNDPQNSQLHYTLGLAYLNLNRLDVAVRCLKRSEELSPSAELKAHLTRLTSPPSLNPTPISLTEAPRSLSPEAGPAAPRTDESKLQPQAKPAQPGQWPPAKKDKETRSGKTVLVIDDSPTIRRVVSLTLERHGFQVVTANDGVDGLTKLQENRVDLVLLDIMMPKLDGYQVCKSIREKKKTVPVIMLSGKDGFFDKVRGKMAGSTAYITKPFEQDDLLKVVQEHCALTVKA